MWKFIFFLNCLFSFMVFSQEITAPTTVGTVYKTFFDGTKLDQIEKSKTDEFVIVTRRDYTNLNIPALVFDLKGNIINKIVVGSPTITALKNGDFATLLMNDFKIYDAKFKEKFKYTHSIGVTGVIYAGNHHKITELKNGNIVFNNDRNDVVVLSKEGKVLHKATFSQNVEGNIIVFPDDTLAVAHLRGIYLLKPDLKLIKELTFKSKEDIRYALTLNKDGILYLNSVENEGLLINSQGNILKSLKFDNNVLAGLALPNGNFVINNRDGSMYFYDKDGNKLNDKHLHSSSSANQMYLLNDKVFYYWNATELVFVNFSGLELGTIKIDAKSPVRMMVNLGNNKILLKSGDELFFVQVNL